jgi:hypothetical protein
MSTALTSCRACHNPVSAEALACPACGQPPSSPARTPRFLNLPTLILLLLVLGGIGTVGYIATSVARETANAAKIKADADVIGLAAEKYRHDHPRKMNSEYIMPAHDANCPTLALLQANGYARGWPATVTLDPWNSAYDIYCDPDGLDDDEVTIVSVGPDRQRQTNDDIKISRANAR